MFKWFSLLVCMLAVFLGWYLAPEMQRPLDTHVAVVPDVKPQDKTAIPVTSSAEVPIEQVVLTQDDPTVEPVEFAALVERGEIDRAVDYVRADPQGLGQDLEALRMLTDAMIKANRIQEAMALLYELRLYWSAEVEPALMQMVFEQVAQSEKRLAVKPVRPEELVALYQNLVILHPDHIPYSLRLATWQVRAGDFTAAEQSLLTTVNDAHYTLLTEEVREELERARRELENPSLRVPLKQVGKHYVAELVFGNGRSAQMMIDTGASLSVLKRELLEGIDGWEQIGVLAINTANGVVEGQRLRMPGLQLGDLALDGVEVGVLPLERLKFDGLLGMDILGRFEFFIDQQQSELLLRPLGGSGF